MTFTYFSYQGVKTHWQTVLSLCSMVFFLKSLSEESLESLSGESQGKISLKSLSGRLFRESLVLSPVLDILPCCSQMQ